MNLVKLSSFCHNSRVIKQNLQNKICFVWAESHFDHDTIMLTALVWGC